MRCRHSLLADVDGNSPAFSSPKIPAKILFLICSLSSSKTDREGVAVKLLMLSSW
jgi:hypothetical protein